MGVAIVGHALGTDDLQGFRHLGRSKLYDNTLLAEIGKHLAANEEAVLPILILAVYILPGAESLDNSGKWIHGGKHYTGEQGALPERPRF